MARGFDSLTFRNNESAKLKVRGTQTLHGGKSPATNT